MNYKFVAVSPKGVFKNYKRLPNWLDHRICYVDINGREVQQMILTSITDANGHVIDASETVEREFKIYIQSRAKAIELGLLKESE